MTEPLSADTQAVLLLCSRLGQRNENGAKPLTLRQYNTLARWLREQSMRPGDLLENAGRARHAELRSAEIAPDIIARLLDPGAALGIMVERWTRQGLFVLSRSDEAYPSRVKGYLGRRRHR
jgi:predicted Rossmann fold nucleotide-binding protein DprA/Smf involved in DNA uptake